MSETVGIDFVRECYDAAGGNWEVAEKRIAKQWQRGLPDDVVYELFTEGAHYLIRRFSAQQRSLTWNGGTRNVEPKPEDTRGFKEMSSECSSWLAYPLRGGIPLGDATVELVREEAEWLEKAGNVYLQKASFFTAIANKVEKVKGENGRVKQVFDEKSLAALGRRKGAK
jgi:hypothetical protein